MQHNRAHHTFTNILGYDEDIRERGYLRFSKHAKWFPVHRYQYIYALFLYPLMTLTMLVKDFPSLREYRDEGLLEENKTTYARQYRELVLSKGFYLLLFIGLPIALGALSWWASLAYFMVVQMVAGFIMSVIFQLAHVVEEAQQPAPDPAGNIENEWMIHQLETTVDFCPTNQMLNWYVGGLNFQVEHHLFPNVCHIHYPAIAKIVRQTAKEFGVAYHSAPTFGAIMGSHLRYLKRLGESEVLVEKELKLEEIAA
jgi:linoleoyl-CoA desaturase